jgi:hypothetical protein
MPVPIIFIVVVGWVIYILNVWEFDCKLTDFFDYPAPRAEAKAAYSCPQTGSRPLKRPAVGAKLSTFVETAAVSMELSTNVETVPLPAGSSQHLLSYTNPPIFRLRSL